MIPTSTWFRCGLAAAWFAALPASAEPAKPPGASATERAAIEAAFARADANGDAKLSREEAQRLPEIAVRFDTLDKNRDGLLTLEEFAVGALQK